LSLATSVELANEDDDENGDEEAEE